MRRSWIRGLARLGWRVVFVEQIASPQLHHRRDLEATRRGAEADGVFPDGRLGLGRRAAADTEADRVLAYLGLEKPAGPHPRAEVFARQSTGLTKAFYERFLADERTRLCGDGTCRGPPLFSAVTPTDRDVASG